MQVLLEIHFSIKSSGVHNQFQLSVKHQLVNLEYPFLFFELNSITLVSTCCCRVGRVLYDSFLLHKIHKEIGERILTHWIVHCLFSHNDGTLNFSKLHFCICFFVIIIYLGYRLWLSTLALLLKTSFT